MGGGWWMVGGDIISYEESGGEGGGSRRGRGRGTNGSGCCLQTGMICQDVNVSRVINLSLLAAPAASEWE